MVDLKDNDFSHEKLSEWKRKVHEGSEKKLEDEWNKLKR